LSQFGTSKHPYQSKTRKVHAAPLHICTYTYALAAVLRHFSQIAELARKHGAFNAFNQPLEPGTELEALRDSLYHADGTLPPMCHDPSTRHPTFISRLRPRWQVSGRKWTAAGETASAGACLDSMVANKPIQGRCEYAASAPPKGSSAAEQAASALRQESSVTTATAGWQEQDPAEVQNG
jgi:hypothetical protein